jgi:hypothetical protein
MYIYQIDGFFGNWIPQGINYLEELSENKTNKKEEVSIKSCNCGAKTVGSNSHSTWCELF